MFEAQRLQARVSTVLSLVPCLTLVALVLVRPFDLVPSLRGIPLLPVSACVAATTLALDARHGRIKLHATPKLALLWVAWGVITRARGAPSNALDGAVTLSLPLLLHLLLAGVSARPRGRALVAATLVTSSCFIAAACLDLGNRSTVCVALPDDAEPRAEGEPDGRSCESVEECWRDPPRLDASYRCERASPLGLRTVDGGRLRYIGILADPNEAGLALALAIPLALALYRRGTSRMCALGRTLIVTLLLGALAGTRSRGAFAALVAAMVAYAWQSGVSRRALAALVVAAPLVVGAARSGERAEASTTERLEIWTEGLAMVRSAPLLGVGRGAFIEHHDLTAHNSFLLAAAEDGIVGLTLWSGLMLSASGLGAGRREHADSEDVLRWRRAVRSSLAGLALGSMFLSLNRHALTWVHLGLAAGVLDQPSSPSRGGRLRAASIALLVGIAALAIVFVATRLPG